MITGNGPSPAGRWAGQLDALDAAATRTHQKPFAALTIAERQAIVSGYAGKAGFAVAGKVSPLRVAV